jgi:hypothetical protein
MDYFNCSENFGNAAIVCPQSRERIFGDNELGHIAGACYSHVASSLVTMIPAPRIPTFQKGWEACEKVYSAWLESETAREQREAQVTEERQRQEVIEFARRLP